MSIISSELLERLPLLAEVLFRTSDLVSADESFAELRPLTREFALSEEPATLINCFLKEATASGWSDPQFMTQDTLSLQHGVGKAYVLISAVESNPSQSLFSSPAHALLTALTERFDFHAYDLPVQWNNEIFDSSVHLLSPTVGTCAKGDSLLVSNRQSLELFSKTGILLKIISPKFDPLLWEFDRHTLKAQRAYASTLPACTMTYLLRFLSQYGSEATIEPILKLTSHPVHYVRWEAVKTLAKLNSDLLPAVLRRLLDDPHPEVRRAARQTLESVEG